MTRTHQPSAQSGQAFIEYLLLTVIIAGVIGGIMYPAFRARMADLQQNLKRNASATISQETMGIPECWFFCNEGVEAKLPSRGTNLATGGGGTSGGGAGGASGAGKNAGGGSGAGTEGANVASNNPLKSNSKNNSSGKVGAESTPPVDPGAKSEAESKKSSQNSSTLAQAPVNKEGGADKKDNDAANSKAADPASAALLGKKKGANDDIREGSSGCRNLDFFTLLKLLAIIAILIIGAIIFFNNRKSRD